MNADSWASLTVANEFVRLRGIPPCNVVYLTQIPDFELVDFETFRRAILAPALVALGQRGLQDHLDYLVYSCDLPFAIDLHPSLGELKLPQLITPVASLNGLTYFHVQVLAGDLGCLRLDANRYMRRPLPLRSTTPPTDAEQQQFTQAQELCKQKQWAEAARLLTELAARHPDHSSLLYESAVALAQAGQPDDALKALEAAFAAGARDYRRLATDDHFTLLRTRPDFRRLITQMQSAIIAVQPAHGFRRTYGWDARGGLVEPNTPAVATAQNYLLSTVLGVTSGRGNSVSEVVAALRRSAAADGTRPDGTIYFLENRDVRSTTREWAFDSAVAALRELGVTARVENGVLPQGRRDVLGALLGAADFDWSAAHNVILPGAICEHLTSTGGMLQEGSEQTPCTVFIRYGAAGTSGTVTEPYALQEKFPTAFLHAHYAHGCSLAEAYYQAVAGPYQLLILGDPLCQPWARRPTPMLTGMAAGATVKDTVKLQPGARHPDNAPLARIALYVDGLRGGVGLDVAEAKPDQFVSLDTTVLPDGYHELAVVAVTGDAIEAQGRVVVPFTVDNHGLALDVTPRRPEHVVWGRPFALRVRGATGGPIQFVHNSRSIDTVPGAADEVRIDPRQLGLGPITLYAIGMSSGGTGLAVRSPPIEFNVEPPDSLRPVEGAPRPPGIDSLARHAMPLPSASAPSVPQTAPGLRLTWGDGDVAVVRDTRPDDWLTQAGVPVGADFKLVGWFEVPEEELYQVQIRTNTAAVVELSGTTLSVESHEGWQYTPVVLARGTHFLRLRGHCSSAPRLDIRLGAAGTQRLSAQRLWHVIPPAATTQPAPRAPRLGP